MPTNLYDRLYKAMYDYPPMVEDLLRHVFSPEHSDFLSQLDFTTLSQLPGDLISKNLTHRMIDRVWRVNFVNSKRFVCFVLEFQTRIDPHMGLRTATYSLLLTETLIKNKLDYPSNQCRYPPGVCAKILLCLQFHSSVIPEIIEPFTFHVAPQCSNIIGTINRPAHSAALESCANRILASGFNNAA